MEHLDTIPADVLTARLATLLDRLIAAADRAAAAAAQVPSPPSSGRSIPALRRTRSAAVITTTTSSKSVTTTSPFHAKTVPPIALRAYLARMARYAPCPNVVFVAVLVYLDRVAAARTRPVALVAATAHRLALTAVVVATKFWSDVFYTNAHYAKVGGVPTAELNRLEMEFLFRAGFELAIDQRDLDEVAAHLLFDEPVEVGQFAAAIPATVRPTAQMSWTSANESDTGSAGAAGAYVSPHRSPPDAAAYHASQESTASFRGYTTAWPHPCAAYAPVPPAPTAATESSTPHRAYLPVSAPQWIDSAPSRSGSHMRCDSALGYGLEFGASPAPEIVVKRERSGSLGEPLAIAGTLATRGGSIAAAAAAAAVTNGAGRPWPSPPDAVPRGAAAATAGGATRDEAVLIGMPYAAPPAVAVHSTEPCQFPSHPRPSVENDGDDQGERLPMPLPTLPRAPRGAAVHTPVGPSRLPSMLSLATAVTRSPSPARRIGHDYASLACSSLDRRQSAPVLRRVASAAVVAPPLASPVRMGPGGGRAASVVSTPSPHRATTSGGGVGKVGTVAGRGGYPYPSASAGMGRDQGHGRHQAPHTQHQQYTTAPFYPSVTHQQQYAPAGALPSHHQYTGHAVPGPAPPSSAHSHHHHHHHHVSYTASSASQYAHYPTAQTPQYPSTSAAARTPQYASVPYPTSAAQTPQYPTSSSSSTAATPHVHPPSHPRMAIPPPSRIATHAPPSSSIPVLAPLRPDSASSSSTLNHHNPTPPPTQPLAHWTPSRRGSLVAELPPVTVLHAPPRTVSKRTSAQVLRPAAPGESPLRRRASVAHLGAAYHAERTDPKQYAYRAQQTAHAAAQQHVQQQGQSQGGQQRIGPYGAVSSLMLVG
ncbi:hypothetical protein AMAG_12285 [Allomyces macrogynus ATCC 38327]|uniref:Cyclin n=1 Tax=Allomyces macrogynus (strain ATCC 38327) TaxID=578462 RepID=A0A0L0SY04_ALLM3|nr:hypothetical protein AMAG_12285 [Allomyces macrogynus ATCC 38327]|eukprot:KNE67214.1 hypothetical protein AMAG_12285 [Allomyces macrogynus ATCC 38327]